MKHYQAIALSGVLWFGIGIFLLYKGIHFIAGSSTYIAIGLLFGFVKGRVIFPKTVYRIVNRIRSFPEPISWKQLYPASYLILLSSMIALGIAARFLPNDIRGLIDVAIGSALINGAMIYYRMARITYGTKSPSQSP